jgi:hypothetical protein
VAEQEAGVTVKNINNPISKYCLSSEGSGAESFNKNKTVGTGGIFFKYFNKTITTSIQRTRSSPLISTLAVLVNVHLRHIQTLPQARHRHWILILRLFIGKTT